MLNSVTLYNKVELLNKYIQLKGNFSCVFLENSVILVFKDLFDTRKNFFLEKALNNY